MTDKEAENKDKEEEKPIVAKTAVDLQRLKLMKLMKNPDKPVMLPERPKAKNTPSVPEFVRNVMGSSAGAGSGEFHVYRHLRRKEYARQKFIQEKGKKELLDDEYHMKLEMNRKLAEEATAKKRAKRLKKKQKQKQKKKLKSPSKDKTGQDKEASSESDTDESEDNEETKACTNEEEKSDQETKSRDPESKETDSKEIKMDTETVDECKNEEVKDQKE